MSESRYIISWQRWLDPLERIFLDSKKNQQNSDFEQSDFSDLHEYSGPVAHTAHGLVPINESNLPSTVFNLWRADTNFVITRNVEILINKELGVEAYDQISPYRFRIAVGKLFDDKDVKSRLEKSIINYKVSKEVKIVPAQTTNKYFLLLHKQFKFFAVVLEGKKKTVIHGESENEVQEKLALHLKSNPESQITYVSTGKAA